jgi:TonB family protein
MKLGIYILALLLISPPLWAQDPAPTLEKPPKLIELVPADIPEGTEFPSPEVQVLLEIEVDESGKVSQVRVVEGPGDPFNTAALEAAKKFTFEPAVLSTGENVPVTINFRMKITAPKKIVPVPARVPVPEKKPDPVIYTGTLIERGTRKPLPGVEVQALFSGETLATTATDDQGRFTLKVPATKFTVIALPPGHERLEAAVEAQPGEEREETFYLEESGGVFETVVRAEAVRREVTRQVIPKEVVEKVAGTSGDVLKVVQNLPGAGRSSFGGGALILRGASPGDSRVFLEGQEIPLLYHFFGIRSTFNSAFLEAVEYVPGNFAPDFGRATGGIVEVKVRDPAADLFRGNVDLNLYDAGFVLEGPLSDSWSIGGAFHRSWVDTFLSAVVPEDANVSFNTAPRYYDYQLIASYHPDPGHKLRLFAYGSMDKVIVLFDRPASDPSIRGEISARIMFHNLQATYSSRLAPFLTQETSLILGLQEFKTELGPEFFFNLDILRFAFRTAWTWEALDWLRVRAGMDIRVDDATIDLISPLRPVEGEDLPPTSTQNRYASKEQTSIYEPAVFAELEIKPLEDLIVLPGVRVDYYRENQRWTVDPRLTVRYRPIEGTVLKGGVGYFQQPPTPDQTDDVLGNPDLYSLRSTHTSLGVEQVVAEGIDVQLAGFYKWLDRLVIRNPAFFSDPQAVPYLSGGTGRILGLELLIRARVGEWFSGWLAYTFQRSYRKDGPGTKERLFDFDQPHILTAVGTFELGSGWSAGFRFRLVSGNPFTPVVGSVYDAASDTYVPIFGDTNSGRLGTFHQLDLRVDKLWTFETWRLGVYLDVQNVYLRENPEGYSYSYDYSNRQPISGIPILPILGVKGEW